MTSIDLVSLMTLIYVLVNDWYQCKGRVLLKGKPGMKPDFSDSEMLTLMVMQDFIPYPGETQYIAYIRANHIREFPKVVDQSQYNRRARNLGALLETLRQDWLSQLGADHERQLLLDTKPVPVVGCTRSKRHSCFLGRAAYGYCAARRMHYFGYKLVSLTTLDGLPMVYDLVPANLDEREAAEAILYRVHDCDIFADKGFLGDDWQADVRLVSNNRIWTSKRSNQAEQNPPAFDSLLKHLREGFDATFHQLQNTGRHLEHLLAKTLSGLCTRIISGIIGWGGTMQAPGIYEKTTPGETHLGELSGELSYRLGNLAKAMESAAPVVVTRNIRGALWSKLAINCTITTLGALTGDTLGVMLREKRVRELFARTYSEVITTADALNIKLERIAANPRLLYVAPNANAINRFAKDILVQFVGRRYGGMKASMLQSLERGRKTEIDFLNGYVVEQAKRVNVPTPVNAALVTLIKEIEAGTRPIDRHNLDDLLSQI